MAHRQNLTFFIRAEQRFSNLGLDGSTGHVAVDASRSADVSRGIRNQLWVNPVAFWEDNVAESPNKARTNFQLARAYMAQPAWDEAEEQLKSAIELDPDFHDAYTTLAIVYIEQQVQAERSEELLTRALDERRDDVHALVGTGVLY